MRATLLGRLLVVAAFGFGVPAAADVIEDDGGAASGARRTAPGSD